MADCGHPLHRARGPSCGCGLWTVADDERATEGIERLRRIAEAGAVLVKHLRTITEALNFTVANLPYEALKTRYREALDDIGEGIAKYGDAIHNEPPEVRYVSSSDSAASGDEISR